MRNVLRIGILALIALVVPMQPSGVYAQAVEPGQVVEAMRSCLPITTVTSDAFPGPEYLTYYVDTADAPTYEVVDTYGGTTTTTIEPQKFMVARDRPNNGTTYRHEPDSLGVMVYFYRHMISQTIDPAALLAIDAYRSRVAACFNQTYPWTAIAPTESAAPPPPPAPPAPTGFNAGNYVNQGNAYNCPDFASQADAQAVLRAEPGDPNQLDTDRDGIACESLPAPKDLQKVPR